MINKTEKQLIHVCSEYINIENYEKAINDNIQMWELHHKLGLEKTRKQLIKENLYYNRPPDELIFLPQWEHKHLHNSEGRNPMCGKIVTDETRQKMSESHKGKTPWNKGIKKCFSEETIKQMRETRKGKPYKLGKTECEETRKKKSLARKGKHRIWNEEHTKFHMG